MIKSVKATNYVGESLTMELAFPEKSGLAITNIEGLGPAQATINTSEAATIDGVIYNGAKLGARNITITLDLRFAQGGDVEAARHLTYKYFPIKKPVELVFETDHRLLQTVGYVETNEPNIFEQNETATISIICPDPYLYSVDEVNTTAFGGIMPKFEFPFSNESLTEKLIEIGEIVHIGENTITYTGDAEIGMTMTIHAKDDVKNITIYNVYTREVLRIKTDIIETLTGSKFSTGDDIIICTKKGMKSARLLRGGKYYNILNSLERNSAWFQLSKGINTFMFSCEEGDLAVQFSIVNDVIYEGV